MKRIGFLIFPLSVFLFSVCAQSPRTQIDFGIKAAQKDLWNEAIFRWEKAIQINPASASAHNNLAVAYEKTGLFKEAEKEYKTALKLKPGDMYIQYNYENFKKNLEEFTKEEKNEDK